MREMITWIFGIHDINWFFVCFTFFPSAKSNTIREDRKLSRVSRVAFFAVGIGRSDGVRPRSSLDEKNTWNSHAYQTETKDGEKGGCPIHRQLVGKIDPKAEIWCQVGTDFKPDKREKHSIDISHGPIIVVEANEKFDAFRYGRLLVVLFWTYSMSMSGSMRILICKRALTDVGTAISYHIRGEVSEWLV